MNSLSKSFIPPGRLAGVAWPASSSHRSCAYFCGPKPWTENAFHQIWSFKRPCSFSARRLRRFFVTACQDGQPASQQSLRSWASKVGETVKDSTKKRHLQVVLFSPQIPGNTGCIARTCAATSVGLHLVEPLGFQIDDSKLKRAGLDYWPYVVVKVHQSWSEFMHYFKQQEGDKRLVAFTKRGTCLYTAKEYKPGDWLVFGSETSGLSPEALEDSADEANYGGGKVRIPMLDTYVRSLNLSVAAGIGIYEALRQLDVLEDLSGDNCNDDQAAMEHLLEAVEA